MNVSKLQSIGRPALRVFATLMLLALPLGAQEPSDAKPIHRSVVIDEPGSYVLKRGIKLSGSGTAITIRADHVTLDLNGHTLSGPGNKLGVGISVEEANGVKIRNGIVSGFGTGVQVMDSNNVDVEGIQIIGRDLGGTPPEVEVGVLILNSKAVVVHNNLISKIFLGIFVRGGKSGGNSLFHNTLTGSSNGELGICYNPAPGNTDGPRGDLVYNNFISRFDVGIATSANSMDNIFRGNNIAYFEMAFDEKTPGSNVFSENITVQISE